MAIQENALNSALAEALAAHDLHAVAEQTRTRTGAKRCDLQIRRRFADRYYTAVECKIGQSTTQRQVAVKDAQRWLKQADCWNSVALCYPEELRDDAPQTPAQRLATTNDLLMARVNQSGVVGRWHRGRLSDLVTLSEDVGANATYAVTDILKRAIFAASDETDAAAGRRLAKVLELPWDPGKARVDPRPARIACLIVANMALLHNRMHADGSRIPGLESLLVVRDSSNRQAALLDNWRRIRDVDYAPVVDPALAVLHGLPSNENTHALLGALVEAVLACVPRLHALQLDHAGPLYHELLQTARYDGSFYTSTAAAVLLAELAIPTNWTAVNGEWNDPNRLTGLRVCDPACGTGTLLMAAARTVEERYRDAGGDEDALDAVHLGLVEDVLHGLDINRHAIHLAASMLTLSAPGIDYNRMNLWNMRHGVTPTGEVHAGSLDLLTNSAAFLPGLAPAEQQRRASASGWTDDAPDLKGRFDLVLMNPPFTRNDIRNRSLSDEDRRKVQQREIELARDVAEPVWRQAIDQSAVRTFFTPIADLLLKKTGTLAMVCPFTSLSSASGKDERALFADPSRFHLELVVTSHDNRRIHFSENTDIHESLLIARRPTPQTRDRPTAFVSLAENPASASEAHFLAEAIRLALEGDNTRLADYGTIAWRNPSELRARPWNAACFYDQSLAEAYDLLCTNSALAPLGKLAAVEPEGRRIRDAFRKAAQRQSPDMRALWQHKSDRQTTMRTSPDEFLVAREGRAEYAVHLWEKRSRLLVVNRMRLNLTRTPAVLSDDPILGSAFIPVSPNTGGDGGVVNEDTLCKAWCVWLNSTFGIVAFLNTRQKNLTYPSFSLDGLRALPAPKPEHADVTALAAAWDQSASKKLKAFPELDKDAIRHALDSAVVEAVPGLSDYDLAHWRRLIALEPSVNNEKDPFRLT